MGSPEQQSPSPIARERTQRFSGVVVGTIVAAGILAVSSAKGSPEALDAGLYMVATVVVLWLAHGWAESLGRRVSGHGQHALLDGLRHELPLLEGLIPPVLALTILSLAGTSDERAITVATWVCVGELGFFGGNAARREGATWFGIARTALGCAALGVLMIALKAVVH